MRSEAGCRQSSVNKAEGGADRLRNTGTERRGEQGKLKAKAGNSVFFTFIHFFVNYILHESVFRLGRSNRKSVGAASQWREAASVKISPGARQLES